MAIGSAIKDVRDAIYQALNGDSTITTTYSAGVHAQSPPDDAPLPYCVVKVSSEVVNNTMGRRGKDVNVQVHVWDSDRRGNTADLINIRVGELIDDETFTIDNWTFITADHEGTITVPDERWKHIVSDFRIRVHS